MINLFQRVLELRKLERGCTLAVLSAGDSVRDYARAFVAGGNRLGAKTLDVNVAPASIARSDNRLQDFSKNSLTSNPGAMAQRKSADLS